MVKLAKLFLPEVEDEVYSRIHRALLNRLNLVSAAPFLSGHKLGSISLGTSQTLVPHKLGRKPEGYIITSNDTNTNISNGTHTKTNLKLTAGTACVVDIWVY